MLTNYQSFGRKLKKRLFKVMKMKALRKTVKKKEFKQKP